MIEEIREEVEFLARTGLFSEEDLMVRIAKLFMTKETYDPQLLNEIERIVEESCATHLSQFEDPTEKSNVDKLHEAGNLMESRYKILFLPNAADTPLEIHKIIKEYKSQTPQSSCATVGYCAFSLFDVTECLNSEKLYISGGSFSNREKEHLKILHTIVDALRYRGLTASWHGDISERIVIDRFKWTFFRAH